jgi:hypothetical protein
MTLYEMFIKNVLTGRIRNDPFSEYERHKSDGGGLCGYHSFRYTKTNFVGTLPIYRLNPINYRLHLYTRRKLCVGVYIII